MTVSEVNQEAAAWYLLNRIRAAHAEHQIAAAEERVAADELHRLIRIAAKDGVPITHIAEAAGVSRQTVYKVSARAETE